MEEKTFQEFVKFVSENWGYRVYKTSPETAIVVGSFLEQPMGYTFKEPNYTNQIKTTQYKDIGNGKTRCVTCGNIYQGAPRATHCWGCRRLFIKEEE